MKPLKKRMKLNTTPLNHYVTIVGDTLFKTQYYNSLYFILQVKCAYGMIDGERMKSAAANINT